MARSARENTKKLICYAGGLVFLGLGFAGMFLPFLPTTIFWILAAWLFAKFHPEMQQKIYDWPKVGPVVRDYLENGIISLRTKKVAISGIILVASLSLYIAAPTLVVASITISILAIVIFYIATRPE